MNSFGFTSRQTFSRINVSMLTKINGSMYTYFVINGVLLLFTYPLLFLVEKTFGFTSNVTLVELSNINNSLLRRMSECRTMRLTMIGSK